MAGETPTPDVDPASGGRCAVISKGMHLTSPPGSSRQTWVAAAAPGFSHMPVLGLHVVPCVQIA